MIHVRDAPLDLPVLDRHRFEPVGECIYCGARADLSDEHIVPFGLGGNLILPDASCGPCARITGDFERIVLRGPLRAVRVARGIQSRRRHRDAPTVLPLEARFGEEWRRVELPYEEHPVIAQFLLLNPPGYFAPDAYEGDISVRGHAAYAWGPHPKDVAEALGAADIRITQSYAPGAFARMIAKIGYGMAVAGHVVELARGRPDVVSAILGHSTKIGHWVGLEDESLERTPDHVLHTVRVIHDAGRGVLLARVQVLSNSGTPTYVVVLGPVSAPYVGQLPN
jgi:hypothetical protein